MAWWDAQHRTILGGSPRSKSRLIMGDAFPRLEPTHIDKHADMERERALLSPVFEEQLGPPTTPALVVHVDIRFTDPVIRSRYCRSYGSSPEFEVTNRICRGLVRRIERCSEEFITRKDSGALEVFKGDTYERKPQRFDMTFRVMRRGKGEWAERTFRSYQKQPLTVALTREVILAAHRMIGLFLRRHDENFRWIDCPVPEVEPEGSETTVPSRGGPLSLLSIPTSRFVEATQTFEFVPGYSIELCFRSRNPQRQVPTLERRIKVNSAQNTPLTLFMSEDMLWKALQFVNRGLDSKKREFDEHLRDHGAFDSPHPEDDTLEIDLRVSNHLGPLYNHVQRNIKSRLALFRDPEARDCDSFLCDMERHLSQIRAEADSVLNAMNDLEFRVVELKGVDWAVREPAKFTLSSSASYGRRTIQAALDRIQTGVGDVIRGHNIAIHINAYKRGHLVLDKAIVAHEKRGNQKETFSSHDDAQTTFVTRLKARIQKDIDKVFEDSCAIDDIPEDEEDYFARPVTPVHPEQAVFDGPSPRFSPSSVRSSPAKQSRPVLSSLQSSPRPRAQRVFSLSRRSTESVRSIDYLKAARDPFADNNSRPSTATSERLSEPRAREPPVPEGRGPLLAAAELKPGRSFSLVSRRSSSAIRVSNASTLVEEQTVCRDDSDGQNHKEMGDPQQRSVSSHDPEAMTSREEVATPAAAPSGVLPGEVAPGASPISTNPAVLQRELSSRDDDNGDAPSIVPQSTQSKMDTPETFVDAREFTVSPVSQEIAEADLSAALTGVGSPRDDDEYSTAPSTPELSTGASSPRQSVLITPVYLRSSLGAKEPVLRNVYPESGVEHAEIDLRGEGAATPDSKEARDRLARDATPNGPPSSSLFPHSVATSSSAVEAPGIAPGDASSQCEPERSDPATRVVSLLETPDAKSAPTPRPSTASSPILEFNNTDPYAASETQVYYTAHLGAESTGAPEACRSDAPDFPTSQVRTWDSTKEGACHLGSDAPGNLESVSTSPVIKVPSVSETEDSAIEAAGSGLGAGYGAEIKPVEDNGGRDVPNDVAEALSGDGPVEAVPSEAHLVADTTGPGTEDSPEADQEPERDQVPKIDTRPDAHDSERHIGGEDTDAGPGLVAERQEEEPISETAAPVQVDPADDSVNAYGSDDTDVRIPEITAGKCSEESSGPGAGSETADVGPESRLPDKVADAVSADHAASERNVESEEAPSGPATIPGKTEYTAEDPEQLLDGRAPAPTVAVPKDDADLRADRDAVTDGTESPGGNAEDNDAVGAVDQDIVSEPQIGASESIGDVSPGGEEKLSTDPALLDAAIAGTRDYDISEWAKEELDMAKAVTDVDRAETPEHDTREETGQEAFTVPAGPDAIGTETSQHAVEDGAENGSDLAPAVTDATDGAEETLALPILLDLTETGVSEAGVAEGGEGESAGIPDVVDDAKGDAAIGAEAEADVASEATDGYASDELEAVVQGVARDIPAPDTKRPEPEICEEQSVIADGQSQGSTVDAARHEETGPGPAVADQELSQEFDDHIDGEKVYESDKEQPCADAGVGNDDDASVKSFGPELGIDRIRAAPGRKNHVDVCTKPGTPGGPRSPDKQVAPAISIDDLGNAGRDISVPVNEAAEPDLSVGIPAGSAASEAPTPKPALSPSQVPNRANLQLAPIPDLSKLSKLSPTPARTSLSSDAASFASIARNSVDTIRPSIDEHRPPILLSELPHTGKSRPQTTGYLGIGLRSESRFVEVGLRGALGDVKARRLSLPLQHLLDSEAAMESQPAPPPPAPQSEAGGSRSKKKPRVRANEPHSNGWDDDGRAVLPRMMMMLAGAVVIGKIMKRAVGE